MNVIFLDIDGVLNVCSEDRDQFGRTYHSNFVDNLKAIIEETDSKIVISSSWRYSGLEFMRSLWEFRKLPGEIIDITPDLYQLSKELDRKNLRGYEVEAWLDENIEVKNYVIIDDDTDFLKNQLSKLVVTSNNINHPDCIDIGYGLTNECKNKAIRILKNG